MSAFVLELVLRNASGALDAFTINACQCTCTHIHRFLSDVRNPINKRVVDRFAQWRSLVARVVPVRSSARVPAEAAALTRVTGLCRVILTAPPPVWPPAAPVHGWGDFHAEVRMYLQSRPFLVMMDFAQEFRQHEGWVPNDARCQWFAMCMFLYLSNARRVAAWDAPGHGKVAVEPYRGMQRDCERHKIEIMFADGPNQHPYHVGIKCQRPDARTPDYWLWDWSAAMFPVRLYDRPGDSPNSNRRCCPLVRC